MKIRTNFVSNSSSSSFLIYGVCLESNKLEEILGLDPEKEEERDYYNLTEKVEEKITEMGIKNYTVDDGGTEGDYVYIGRSWDGVGDNQTGKEFKEEIETWVNKLLGNKKGIKFETHEACYYS